MLGLVMSDEWWEMNTMICLFRESEKNVHNPWRTRWRWLNIFQKCMFDPFKCDIRVLHVFLRCWICIGPRWHVHGVLIGYYCTSLPRRINEACVLQLPRFILNSSSLRILAPAQIQRHCILFFSLHTIFVHTSHVFFNFSFTS